MTNALTYADEPGEDSCLHDELIWCDDNAGRQAVDGRVAARGGASRASGEEVEHAGCPTSGWLDEIPDGNDHSIDAVRYAMMDDVLRG